LRFARQGYVEETRQLINPVLTGADPLYSCEPGSWGPAEADRLVDAVGGWNNPAAN
jgi:glucose-6-phosphate 1-dehydrogenase